MAGTAGSAQSGSVGSSPNLAQISGIVAGIVAAVALSVFAALCVHRRATRRARALRVGENTIDNLPLSPAWMLVSGNFGSNINIHQ